MIFVLCSLYKEAKVFYGNYHSDVAFNFIGRMLKKFDLEKRSRGRPSLSPLKTAATPSPKMLAGYASNIGSIRFELANSALLGDFSQVPQFVWGLLVRNPLDRRHHPLKITAIVPGSRPPLCTWWFGTRRPLDAGYNTTSVNASPPQYLEEAFKCKFDFYLDFEALHDIEIQCI